MWQRETQRQEPGPRKRRNQPREKQEQRPRRRDGVAVAPLHLPSTSVGDSEHLLLADQHTWIPSLPFSRATCQGWEPLGHGNPLTILSPLSWAGWRHGKSVSSRHRGKTEVTADRFPETVRERQKDREAWRRAEAETAQCRESCRQRLDGWREPAQNLGGRLAWRQPQRLMGETLRAGGSLEGTETPGVRRKQEGRGPSRRALSAWEETAEGGRVLTWGLCEDRGPGERTWRQLQAQEQGQASPSGPHLVQQIPGLKTAAGSAGARGGDLPCGLWEPLGAATWRKEEGGRASSAGAGRTEFRRQESWSLTSVFLRPRISSLYPCLPSDQGPSAKTAPFSVSDVLAPDTLPPRNPGTRLSIPPHL